MKSENRSPQNPVKLILNASPDADLLSSRAKMLNDAGYYTSSAHNSDEITQIAATMRCDVAIICHSFDGVQQKSIQQRLQEVSPGTHVVFVNRDMDQDRHIFVTRIREAFARLSN